MSEFTNNIVTDGENIQFTVLEGSAPKNIELRNDSYQTDITSPFRFYAQKYGHIDPKKHNFLVRFSYDNKYLELIENAHDTSGGNRITGKIELANPIKDFGINSNKTYTAKELSTKLKMNRILFFDKDAGLKLVANLMSFKAKVDTEIESIDTDRGNKRDLLDINIKHDYDLKFTLVTEIIVGGPKVKFEVEIAYDLRDKAITFWLESVEMKEILDGCVKELIDKEIENFKKEGIPIIHCL